MEAAQLAPLEPLEPLNESGPEMPAAPASIARPSPSQAPARPAPLPIEEGPDAAIAPLLLGVADELAPLSLALDAAPTNLLEPLPLAPAAAPANLLEPLPLAPAAAPAGSPAPLVRAAAPASTAVSGVDSAKAARRAGAAAVAPPVAVPTVGAPAVASPAAAAARPLSLTPSAPVVATPAIAAAPAVATSAAASAAPASASPATVAPAPAVAPPPIVVSTAPVGLPAGAAPSAAPPVAAPPVATAAAPAAPAAAPTPVMDRDFIARNQIVERYLSGRLPVKGATDFERFCKENPGMLDELGLAERVNAGLRLLEASGKPEPWQDESRKFWQKPQLVIGLAAAVAALLIGVGVLWSTNSARGAQIAKLQKHVATQPLEPATKTRTIRLLPNYQGSSNTPAVTVGDAGETQLADLKIDMSRSQYRSFRVTIDRVDQGRVAVLHNLLKDSNGHMRVALNTSALGPGNYQFTIEGMTWKGDPVPEAWITIGIVH